MKFSIDWKNERQFYRTTTRFEDRTVNITKGRLHKTADQFITELRKWSTAHKLHDFGNPPARRTGNLDSSIIKETIRDSKGRFSGGKDAIMIQVRINPEEGKKYHGRGNYAQALEKSPKYDRPFIKPAADRTAALFNQIMLGRL